VYDPIKEQYKHEKGTCKVYDKNAGAEPDVSTFADSVGKEMTGPDSAALDL
jgi:hypothetical protein